jgi:hypothetical protein
MLGRDVQQQSRALALPGWILVFSLVNDCACAAGCAEARRVAPLPQPAVPHWSHLHGEHGVRLSRGGRGARGGTWAHQAPTANWLSSHCRVMLLQRATAWRDACSQELQLLRCIGIPADQVMQRCSVLVP